MIDDQMLLLTAKNTPAKVFQGVCIEVGYASAVHTLSVPVPLFPLLFYKHLIHLNMSQHVRSELSSKLL